MTGANGDAGSSARPERRWDVALSFAGAQRHYVELVAQALKARGVRCFYDADRQVRLWGTHLAEVLPQIYASESEAVVVFISADYAAGDWTRLERRAAFSRAVAEAGAYVLPARFDDSELPGLLPDVVTVDVGDYTPERFADLVVEKLADFDIGAPPPSGAADAPAGGVRVSKADLRRLGVHAAISVPGVPDDVPPEYVLRDADAGIRSRVAVAAERGGFVLLVGGSSVGKTRCAVEAVKELLPDWWLVHPAEPTEVAALAGASPQRTVVWLDELQRYLDGEHPLTGGVVRALVGGPHPVVVIGTLWPDRYTAYTTLPLPGGSDPHAREREVLDLAEVIRIAPEFSPAEQGRASTAAARDRRLAVALESAGYGLTQTLAAAPHLVARWQDARTAAPYAWAVLTAALDAARLGARVPLTADFLRAAAPGYCTSAQQAEAPDNWFEQALVDATGKLHGATAALSPAGAGMGQTAGYTVADYLIQHASRERLYVRVPASTWDAAVSYLRDPIDAARLADSATNRLLYRYAILLYRRAAGPDIGDEHAAGRLADLLIKRGDLDGAAQILHAWADVGSGFAAERLAMLLTDRGDLDGLRPLADAGDLFAARGLAWLLEQRSDPDGAIQILRSRVDAGDERAAEWLADLLVRHGHLDGAARLLPSPADTGGAISTAGVGLDLKLAEAGDLDGLRPRADAGDGIAADLLADLLAKAGDLDGLRARADTGDGFAARRLGHLLAKAGDLDGLRAWADADAGDEEAAGWLADLLAKAGDLDALRARADAGDQPAALRLADLLAKRGDFDQAKHILQARVDDERAAERLTRLLAEAGDLDGAYQILHAWVNAGDEMAAEQLTRLLAPYSDLEWVEQKLRTWADAGSEWAARQLTSLLTEQGNLHELRAQADADNGWAHSPLADLLAERGDLDELRARADAGKPFAGKRLADLPAERGDLDELRARVDAGDWDAAERLADLLTKQGRGEEAERLRQFGLNPDGSIAYA